MPCCRPLEDRFKAELPEHLQGTRAPLTKQPDKHCFIGGIVQPSQLLIYKACLHWASEEWPIYLKKNVLCTPDFSHKSLKLVTLSPSKKLHCILSLRWRLQEWDFKASNNVWLAKYLQPILNSSIIDLEALRIVNFQSQSGQPKSCQLWQGDNKQEYTWLRESYSPLSDAGTEQW